LASEYVAAHPMPNRDVFDDYYRFKALILPTLGTKTGIWIAALSKVNQLTPTQTRLLIISGIMTGGILGVFLGTVDNGDINSPAFHQKLATDKKLWVDYEEYFRSLCSIFTKRWKPDMDAKSRAEWELSIKNINSQKASELKRCLD
jgi:hypothetical protein